MQTHTHAPPGASGGQTALARLLAADWSKGIPAGYLEALDRLRRIRSEFEEQIAAAIDGLDILDMAIVDLEDDGEVGKPTTLDAMNPFDSEDSEPWLAGSPPPNPCIPLDAEGDQSDDEYSLGAPESVTCSDGPATPVRKARRKLPNVGTFKAGKFPD